MWAIEASERASNTLLSNIVLTSLAAAKELRNGLWAVESSEQGERASRTLLFNEVFTTLAAANELFIIVWAMEASE